MAECNIAGNGGLERLRELTARLPDLTVLSGGAIEYGIQGGTAYGTGLYNVKDVAVQKLFMEKGTTFPEHAHDEFEFCVIYKGRLSVEKEGEKCELGIADFMAFDPGVVHSATALEDTSLILITVPSGKGYPNGWRKL